MSRVDKEELNRKDCHPVLPVVPSSKSAPGIFVQGYVGPIDNEYKSTGIVGHSVEILRIRIIVQYYCNKWRVACGM